MTTFDFTSSLPLIIVSGTAMLVMLAIAVRRSHLLAAILTAAGLLAALAVLVRLGVERPGRPVSSLLTMDGFAVFFVGVLLAATLLVVLLSYGYLRRYPGWREEYYVLLLIATLGGAVLVSANHFATLFLGLETLSVSLYALIAYFPRQRQSLEAGLKYLVLAAATSAFLLLGMALIYAELGSLQLDGLLRVILARPDLRPILVLPGMGLIFVGIGFKLALVPFHMWTPDIYQGAPAPVAAFVATVSKGAVLALLLRYFHLVEPVAGEIMRRLLAAFAVASMLTGNLLALLQDNLKRILAYSSIAHLGYLLVCFQSDGPMVASTAALYLVAYMASTLGAFAVITLLSAPGHEVEMLDDYRGLFRRRPVLASALTVMLLSLAGIPLTVGFMAKFWVVVAGLYPAAWVPLFTLVIASTIGLYYYLRVIVAMYGPTAAGEGAAGRLALGARLVLGAVTVLVVWLGVYPYHLQRVVGLAMATLWE